MAIMKPSKSIIDYIDKNGPIMKEIRKPPIKFIKSQSYGVRKLWKRLKDQ